MSSVVTSPSSCPKKIVIGKKEYQRECQAFEYFGAESYQQVPYDIYWKENQTMLLKIYSTAIILLDVFVLLAKCVYAIFEGLYLRVFPPAEKSVAGEVVVITGTGHGIGRELAIQFAELEATVVCLDINTKGNEETVKMIKEKGLNRVFLYNCDVSSQEEVQATVEVITREVGPVTVLVNNAGIMPCRRFLDYRPEEIKKIFDVNLFAHFWLLKEILPNMIETNRGHIVALSSMAGVVGIRNLVPYCASKFAVRGMMEALAEELREERIGIDINFTCIFPYMVNTGLCKKPRVRFPGILAMVSPKVAAQLIIQAMRRNMLAVTIPSWYLLLHDVVRLFPFKVGRLIKDFMDVELEAD